MGDGDRGHIIAAAVMALAAALATPGCSRAGDAPVTIRFWAMGNEGENVKMLLPAFEREHPGITVELQVIPWTAAHEKLLTAYAGNSLPDVWQLGNTWVPEFQLLQAIEDLRPWDRALERDRLGVLLHGDLGDEPGRRRALGDPLVRRHAGALLQDRSVACGRGGWCHPERGSEWLEVCRNIKRRNAGSDAYAMLLPTNEFAPPLILGMQTGARFLRDRDTKGDFSSPEFTRAFSFYTQFFEEGLAPVGRHARHEHLPGHGRGVLLRCTSPGPGTSANSRGGCPTACRTVGDGASAGSRRAVPGSIAWPAGRVWPCPGSRMHKAEVWALIEYLSDPARQVEFYGPPGVSRRAGRRGRTARSGESARPGVLSSSLRNVRPHPKVPEWERIMMRLQDYR